MLIRFFIFTEILLAVSSVILWFAGIYFVFINQLILSMVCFILFTGFIFSSGRIGDLRLYIIEKRRKASETKNALHQED